MKLDIINYNPNINEDSETIVNMINIFENIKKNISTSKYIAYQNILNKITRFLNMIGSSFEKEIEKIQEKPNYFDEPEDDDIVSIGSISEYECEDIEDDITRENEEIEIYKYEKNIHKKYNECFNRFDIDIEFDLQSKDTSSEDSEDTSSEDSGNYID